MEHNTSELRILFKHLILFLIVALILRFWNMIIFVSFPWSQIIIVLWIVILSIHLILFFMSTGVMGVEYENIPVKLLTKRLIDMIKQRNLRFKESISNTSKMPTTPPNNPVN